MKVRFERDGIAFEYECHPVLVGVGIAGAVFLVALRMVGVAAVFGALAALVAVGFYKLAKDI